ncbi:hypothetical protein H7J93_08485 [Mycobacterium barrassiae]|uniref:hypothetical protein n=1 Tax=Mycobacterium barrassiae TaxID=319709 RepID=UPI002265CF91|nr:hypothetical protein [Mycobacterium barrassiae]MCV7299671.1 hypothetical protein [Mycobacterium barrassiae]
MDDVFIGSEAVANGVLTRGRLRSRYRALFPDVYVATDAIPSLTLRAVGAWLWSRRRAVVAGTAAAAMHGARPVNEATAIELVYRSGRPPPGILTRNEHIEADEIDEIAGVPVTTPARTAFDLARHRPRDIAVASLDALAAATGITACAVQSLVDRYARARHWWRAVESLRLMDGGAQSEYQTMVRLALIDAGLPAPTTQFTVTDGKDVALIAMGYKAPKVAIEFGTATPEFVVKKGWKMISATDFWANPKVVAYLMRAEVADRGFPLWKLSRLSRA